MGESNWTTVKTPIGEFAIEASGIGITRIAFEADAFAQESARQDTALLKLGRKQLTEYFGGSRTDFDLPLDYTGTEFQMRVWKALLRIPFGKTKTYGELAREVGKDLTVARAVGVCCGRNPLPIIIPCHRVVGANGSLTGFGGGVWRKEWLLKHEGALDPSLKL